MFTHLKDMIKGHGFNLHNWFIVDVSNRKFKLIHFYVEK
ncbi:hypothetical protein LINPERHAP1_LOCUS4166, partial [Linum perenne]